MATDNRQNLDISFYYTPTIFTVCVPMYMFCLWLHVINIPINIIIIIISSSNIINRVKPSSRPHVGFSLVSYSPLQVR